jgi:predicted RNase H-like nuclease
VLGVDGAAGGWVGVALVDGAFASLGYASGLRALVEAMEARHGALGAIAIDMPLALRSGQPRAVDALARARLPGRARSRLYARPPREAMEAPTHAAAVAVARRLGAPAPSRQAYGLRAAIADAAAFARSIACARRGAFPGAGAEVGAGAEARARAEGREAGPPVSEAHPELSLLALGGAAAIAHTKKSWAGHCARREALAAAGIVVTGADVPDRVAPDDVLDAAAVAWTAARLGAGAAEVLADPEERALDPLLALAI